jgi:hypothetical protein
MEKEIGPLPKFEQQPRPKATPETKSEIRPLHDSFIGLDPSLKRKLGSLKAEANRLTTEEYLAEGRGEDNIKAARASDLERVAKHEAMVKRGREIREARAAEQSLLGRFKKSLATMNERLFGKPPTATKSGNESSAERPE